MSRRPRWTHRRAAAPTGSRPSIPDARSPTSGSRTIWGKDLPVNRGLYNFDEIRYEYYRDADGHVRGLQGRRDRLPGRESPRQALGHGYDIPAVEKDKVVLVTLERDAARPGRLFLQPAPAAVQGQARVREAIGPTSTTSRSIQRTLLFGKYKRVESYFPNSDYGASGPPTAEELAILEPYRDQLPPEVFTEAFEPAQDRRQRPKIRANLRKALALFKEAGWVAEGRQAGPWRDRRAMANFEIMTASPETQTHQPCPSSNPEARRHRRLPTLHGRGPVAQPASTRRTSTSTDRRATTSFRRRAPSCGIYFGIPKARSDPAPATSDGLRQDPVADDLIDRIVGGQGPGDEFKATTRALDRVSALELQRRAPVPIPDEAWHRLLEQVRPFPDTPAPLRHAAFPGSHEPGGSTIPRLGAGTPIDRAAAIRSERNAGASHGIHQLKRGYRPEPMAAYILSDACC